MIRERGYIPGTRSLTISDVHLWLLCSHLDDAGLQMYQYVYQRIQFMQQLTRGAYKGQERGGKSYTEGTVAYLQSWHILQNFCRVKKVIIIKFVRYSLCRYVLPSTNHPRLVPVSFAGGSTIPCQRKAEMRC